MIRIAIEKSQVDELIEMLIRLKNSTIDSDYTKGHIDGGRAVADAILRAGVDISDIEKKAKRWDDLRKQIDDCYFDENGNERDEEEGYDLITIGERTAIAMGYL